MSKAYTRELIRILDPISVSENFPEFLTGISQDSRLIQPGFVFAVRSGGKSAGSDYIAQARMNGAALLLTGEDASAGLDFPMIKVRDFRKALVDASRFIYGDPSRKLKLTGITGTNGKTSTVHILRSIFEVAGAKCAMLSTVGYWTGAKMEEAPLTTPDIDRIHALLGAAVDAGAEYATMEVSSHALDQGRVHGLHFSGAGFSNLSVDHLDYHKNLFDYCLAKERLFRALPLGSIAAVNIESRWSNRIIRACWSPLVTVGKAGSGADLRMTLLNHSVTGGKYLLEWNERKFEVNTPLVGVYQGENLALAAALALTQGIDIPTVIAGISSLLAVPGRMEAVICGQPFALFVDYAHTPDALQRALRSIRHLTSGKIIVVFGCGGDRDRSKRPQMGKIASEEADFAFITSDNSRTEDPEAITAEILAGVNSELLGKTTVIVNRREATLAAIRKATPGDIVLLAGKGSEWYMEINGVRHPYDDRIVAGECLHEIGFKKGSR